MTALSDPIVIGLMIFNIVMLLGYFSSNMVRCMKSSWWRDGGGLGWGKAGGGRVGDDRRADKQVQVQAAGQHGAWAPAWASGAATAACS